MKTMSIAVNCLSLFGAFTGLIPAYRWYRASEISVNPNWHCEPVETEDKAIGYAAAAIEAYGKSSILNKKAATAAIWTGASMLLYAVAQLFSICVRIA